MSSGPPTELRAGVRVADRYLVEAEVEGSGGRSFLARHVERDVLVDLITISAEEAAALKHLVGVTHQHLARVLEITVSGAQHVLVVEHVRGTTLEERLNGIQRKAPVDAVRSALRVADALTFVHDHDAVHGLISTRAVIVEPEGRPPPVLTYAPGSSPLRAPIGTARGPEASMADDAWAVAALLHWMLVGLAPPLEGYDREGELEDLGVRDETLRQALFHALARSLDVRGHDLKPLRRELARWFVEHAAEESLPPAPHSQRPPPLPSNPERQEQTKLIRRRPVVSENAPRKRRASHIGAFALGAIGLGLIAGWVASALREKDEEVKLVPRAAPSASAASAPPKIQLGAIPVTGEREALLGDKLATCVAGYLPPETFASTPDVGFVCSETDPRLGAEKLRVAVVASGPKGHASDAMKIFARIGWYDMPAFAVVRAGCCPDAPPLVIDKLAESCPQMDQALREIGETVVAMKPVQEPLKKYTDSIHCELNAGHGTLLRRTQRPVGGEDTAFLELVKELETQ